MERGATSPPKEVRIVPSPLNTPYNISPLELGWKAGENPSPLHYNIVMGVSYTYTYMKLEEEEKVWMIKKLISDVCRTETPPCCLSLTHSLRQSQSAVSQGWKRLLFIYVCLWLNNTSLHRKYVSLFVCFLSIQFYLECRLILLNNRNCVLL